MTLYPNTAALLIAAQVKTFMAASKLKLYKAIASPISVSTVIGDLTEADYDGYAEIALATWFNPYIDPAGGATIQCGTKQFEFVTDIGTTNNVLGFYVLDAGGDLIVVGNFPEPIPMTMDGDAIPVNVSLNYCAPGV